MVKWMLAGDFHIPFHNRRYLDLWFDVVKYWKPDVVDIVGDLDDAQCVSRYADGTAQENEKKVAAYAPLVQEFFRDLRTILPDSEIVFHLGNHCSRHQDYISRKAPALQGLITPELLWKVDTYGIDYHYYEQPPVKRYGKFYVHHGIYAQSGAGNSARKMMDEFGISIISGHTHRQAIVNKTYELTEEVRTGIELGHLVDIKSGGFDYTNLRDWQPGFGIAHIDGENVHAQTVPIIDNSCVVDGRVFKE